MREADRALGWYPSVAALTAAREALAPIRAVIERWAAETNLPPEALTLLDETRPLVYPSEEL